MDGSKSDFVIVSDDASSKCGRKSSNSESEKANGVKRKSVRRSKVLKSDGWYKKAALSIKISGKTATNFIQAYMNIEK